MLILYSGNPLFLEPYWRRHAGASVVVFSGWHRMSYVTTDSVLVFQSVELQNHIRMLHKAVGNAVVDDKHVVLGAGSLQLINALVYALSPDPNDDAGAPPARVVSAVPYYGVSSAHPLIRSSQPTLPIKRFGASKQHGLIISIR
jgi:hypothetical protein